MRPQSLTPLFAQVTSLSGIGPRLGKLVERLSGPLVVDLLWHLPVGVADRQVPQQNDHQRAGQALDELAQPRPDSGQRGDLGEQGGKALRTHGWRCCLGRDFAPARAYMLRPFLRKPVGKMGDDTELELRRKRLLYRSIYRGNKENDILLGQFARAHIAEFSAAELDQYERLLATGDNDIFDWVAGKAAVPPDMDT